MKGPAEFVVSGFGGRKTQHHDRIASCGHKIIALFDHFPVFAVIKPEFLPPVIEVFEDLESAGLHSGEHVHEAGLDAHRLVLELRVLMQDVTAAQVQCRRLPAFPCCRRAARPMAIPCPRREWRRHAGRGLPP